MSIVARSGAAPGLVVLSRPRFQFAIHLFFPNIAESAADVLYISGPNTHSGFFFSPCCLFDSDRPLRLCTRTSVSRPILTTLV